MQFANLFEFILLEERPYILAPSQTAHKKRFLRKIDTEIRTENVRFSVSLKYTLCIIRNYKKKRSESVVFSEASFLKW